MTDGVDVHGRVFFVLAGEFGAVSKLAARMNLSVHAWVHLPSTVTPPVVFERLDDAEAAALIVPGSGRG